MSQTVTFTFGHVIKKIILLD